MRKTLLAIAIVMLPACGSGGSIENATLGSDPYFPNEKPGAGLWNPVTSSTDTPSGSIEFPGCAGQEMMSPKALLERMAPFYCGLAQQCAGSKSYSSLKRACEQISLLLSENADSVRLKSPICASQVDYCLDAIKSRGCELLQSNEDIPGCSSDDEEDDEQPPTPTDGGYTYDAGVKHDAGDTPSYDAGVSTGCTACVKACDGDQACMSTCYQNGDCP